MSTSSFIRIFLSVFVVVVVSATIHAQDTLLSVSYNAKLDSIESTILHQKRYIQVFLPPSYKPGSTDRYDVLYVLDGGNWNMSVVAQQQRFIQNEGHMPPTIIVSVTGIDRNIELTPTVLKTWNAPTGGGDKFLSYIKNELIPYVNKTYPSNGDNTLWGHSLSGMFAIYTMLKEPTLFKSFIAVDPSIWWDNSLVAKLAAEKLPAMKDSSITLFISGRSDYSLHDMRIDTMDIVLKKYAPSNLKWKIATYENETHSSMRMKGTYDGLMYAYEGLTSDIGFIPMNGIVVKDKPYSIIYTDDTTRLYYTLDGSVPTSQSRQVSRLVSVTGPATVTYKRIGNRDKYSKSVSGSFTIENLPPPIAKPKKAVAGGFRYSYYEGDSTKRPDPKTARLVRKGIFDKNFKIDSLPRKSNYALVMEGLLEITEEGYHTFFAKAGKGTKIWIDGKLIMHWDDNDKHEYFVYMLPLSKGFYPVRIESFDKKEDFNLLFYYNTPSMPPAGDPIQVPFEKEYSVGK